MVASVRAVGAVDAASAWIPGLPSGWQPDDICFLIAETIQTESVAATGWVHVTGSPVTTTTTRLHVLWRRMQSGDSAPTVTGPSDHAVTRIIGIQKAITSGNPWDAINTGTESTADTSASFPGVTTTDVDELILEIIATGRDSTSASLGALTNGNYSGITEQMDNFATAGGGGGIACVSARKATAGATGNSTATMSSTDAKAMMTIAIKNAPPATPPDPTGDVVYVDSTTTGDTANTTSRAPAVPAGATTMDVVIVNLSRWSDPASNPTITPPDGSWISLGAVLGTDNKQRNDRFAKRLTDDESGTYNFSWPSTLMWTTAHATLYRGVQRDLDLSTLAAEGLETSASDSGGTSFPSVTLNGVPEGAALHWHGTSESVSPGHTVPTNWTEVEENDCDVTAHRSSVAAGNYTTGTSAVGVNSDHNLVSMVALPPEPAEATDIDLVPANATQAHTAASPSLTQVHVLAVDAAVQAHSAGSPTLVENSSLVVADAVQAHAATTVALTQVHVLAVDNAAQGHTAASPTLVENSALVVDSATHAHTSDSPALTQVHVLAVDAASHAHSSGSPTLVENSSLLVDAATHAHAAEAPTLVQQHVLAVDSATHSHAADSVVLTQAHELAVDAATHAQTSESPVLTQSHVLAVDGAVQAHTATEVVLTQDHTLAVDNAAQAHTAAHVTLAAEGSLSVDDAVHAHAAGSPALVQQHTLAVNDAVQAQSSDQVTLTAEGALAVDNAQHAHTAASPTLTQQHSLAVDDAVQAHTAETPTILQVHVLTVDDAVQAQSSSSPSLTEQTQLQVDDAEHAQTAEQVFLTLSDLTVHDAVQAQTAETVDFAQAHQLIVDAAFMELMSDVVTVVDVSGARDLDLICELEPNDEEGRVEGLDRFNEELVDNRFIAQVEPNAMFAMLEED